MKIKVKAEVELPQLPNFLRYGSENQFAMDVADVSEESLRQIGAAWTEELVKHAAKRAKENANART